jgi:hypothetical protein
MLRLGVGFVVGWVACVLLAFVAGKGVSWERGEIDQ